MATTDEFHLRYRPFAQHSFMTSCRITTAFRPTCLHNTQKMNYLLSWFQTFAVFCMLYVFFWVIPRRLNFICRRFRILCLFHLHRQVSEYSPTCLWRWNRQSVPKRRHIKFRRRGITQNKTYNIQNTAKVWNQEYLVLYTTYQLAAPLYTYISTIINLSLCCNTKSKPCLYKILVSNPSS